MNFFKYISLIIFCFYSSTLFAQEEKSLATAINEMERVYNETYDADLGIKTCKAVLEKVPAQSKIHFETLNYLGNWYIENREEKSVEAILEQMKRAIETSNKKKNKALWIYYLNLNARYNSEITYNTEKAIIQAFNAFFTAKAQPQLLKPTVLQTAITLAELGQYDRARNILKLYKISEKLNYKNEFEQCKYLIKLGQVYFSIEDYNKAHTLFEKALKIIEPKAKENPTLYERCILELARSTSEVYDSPDGIEILKKLPQNENRHYQYWVIWAKYSFSSLKDIEENLMISQKALISLYPNFSSTNIKDNPQDNDCIDYQKAQYVIYRKAIILYNKGLMYLKQGKKKEAITFFEQSITTTKVGVKHYNQVIDRMIGFNISNLVANQDLHILMGAMIHSAFGIYDITKSRANFNQLFQFMEQRRSLSILQHNTLNPIPEKLLVELNSYCTRIVEYELTLSNGDNFSFEKLAEIANLTFEYEDFIQNIKQETDKVRLTTDDFNYISADDLQSSLGEESVFIQYSVARRYIYAISISKSNFTAKLVYNGDAMIEEKVFPFIKMIKTPLLVQSKNRQAFIDNSNYFYNILIRPFEAEMKGKTRFIVSPERELLFLPYEILLSSSENKPFHELDFLIKSHEINYRYSATLHKKIQARPAIKDYSILAFAPVFEDKTGTGKENYAINTFKSSRYSSMDNKTFIYLPNSKYEVETISNLLSTKNQQTTTLLLLNNQATKENLTTQINSNTYQFIHLATHSMVNLDDPRNSAIACYQVENKENLYSSYEIEKMHIQADLVVLSSCESGIGRIIEGEGVIGLNRSFINSGARNVLFSLWKVDDNGSSELMINFYKSYIQNQNYTASLRDAKLKMLEDPVMANPRYWAPFVLIGE